MSLYGHKTSGTLLIVEDDPLWADRVRDWLSLQGWACERADTLKQGIALLSRQPFDVVLLSARMGGVSSLDALARTEMDKNPPAFIVLAGESDAHLAGEALRHGAFDFQVRPIDMPHLQARLARALEFRNYRHEASLYRRRHDADSPGPKLPAAAAEENVRQRLMLFASGAPTPVLLRGESGVGKEMAARALHHFSNRAGRAFLYLDCAELSAAQIESELFGREAGTAPGTRNNPGLLELADGGAILIDHLSEMPLDTQGKLLGAMETRRVIRLGGTSERLSDFWVIAATDRELQQEIRAGTFRADLYYRLSVLELEIPPLRERQGEIASLAADLCAQVRGPAQPPVEIMPEAVEVLRRHDWPGNVRELHSVIESALADPDVRRLTASAVRSAIARVHDEDPTQSSAKEYLLRGGKPSPLRAWVEAAERDAVMRALDYTAGNRTRAAEILDISRATITRIIAKYNLGNHPSRNLPKDTTRD
ncbi:MAG: sigma-54-dependent Fis family transcriptional regulator [Chrysiogenetes bacterium]|nr:sigma-54-dependent Fis family transcriptional regulator [Chrysiogenetes bacterium]